MKENRFLSNKMIRMLFEAIAVVFALFIVSFTIIATSSLPGSRQFRQNFYELDTDWKVVRASGRTEDITLPHGENMRSGEVMVLEGVLPKRITGRESVAFRTYKQDIKVYVGGKLRETYNTGEEFFIWRTPISKFVYVSLESGDSSQVIRIEGRSDNDNPRGISRIYYGEKSAIVSEFLSVYLVSIIFATAFFGLGIVSIVGGYILRFVAKTDIHLDAMGWAMLLVSLWDFTQSDFRDFIFSNAAAVNVVPVFALFGIPIFIAGYFNWLQGRRYSRIHMTFVAICLCAASVVGILVFKKVISPDDLVEPAFVVLYGEFALIVITSVLDKKKLGNIDYMDYVIGCGVVGFCGLLQIYDYYSLLTGSDGIYFSMGFAFLTVMAVCNAIRKLIMLKGSRQAAVSAADLKSQFLATMSHEIRTPINAIMGMNEAIIRESNEEHIVSYARDVESAGKLLLYLVNDILDFSKLESGKMTLVYAAYSVKQLILKCHNIVNGKVKEKGLDFIVDVDESVPSVLYGDEVRIQQIIINLLNNAIKYTDSGEVTLKIYPDNMTKESIDLHIEVIDTGRGIKEENLENLFDAFTRTQDANNSRVEGTGLGLAITSKFVNLMEGSISVKSNYGEGSCFTVVLPQRIISENPVGKFGIDDAEIQEKPKTDADIMKFPGVKLLVVDDVQLNIKVVTSLLKKAEMEIDCATSGDECLEKCKQKKYDVILLDHMMPEKDGIQTLWELRRDKKNENNETPVIMMTANAMNGAREEYMGLGFSDYVSKPFNMSQLQKIIEKNLRSR